MQMLELSTAIGEEGDEAATKVAPIAAAKKDKRRGILMIIWRRDGDGGEYGGGRVRLGQRYLPYVRG